MTGSYGCKVCRVLDEREVPHYDSRMVDMWTAESGKRKGYRQIARWLNVTLLRREMDLAGLPTLAGEAESKFDRLQSDSQESHEVRTLLEREGIDVDRLESDFVSYGVVRTHLKECLGVDYEPPEPSEWEQESIEISQSHAEEKVRSAVTSLINKQKLGAASDVTVHVDLNVECQRCHSKISLNRAIRRGYVCQCATSN